MVTVNISQGILKGSKVNCDNGIVYYEFLGVPYARPPIGELRFKTPQPPVPWDGVRDATTINKEHISYQFDIKQGVHLGSEDCLYLNVYTPKIESSSNLLPVMFFIHGGGFIYSTGIDKGDLGPDYLIEHDVVVVTINYRLGVFGFLQLGIPEAAGNMGLKDQQQALRWVQGNIHKFGGDRNNVTVFGISAGSASVGYQILSPLGKNLFHKAIFQSGSTLNHWTMNFEPKKLTLKLLEAMGYNGNTEDDYAIYEYLFKSPALLIVQSSFKVIQNYGPNKSFFGFVPTIEKDFGNNEAFITEKPYKLLKEGRYCHVPVIKGFCNREGYLTSVINASATSNLLKNKNFIDFLSCDMEDCEKEKWNRRLLIAYLEDIKLDDESDKMAVDFFGDLDFVAGTWLSGEIMAKDGVPVYIYELCYEGNINFFKHFFGINRKGTAHGDDIAYIFKHSLTKLATEKDIGVRAKLTKLWTNFAKNGVPNSDDISIQWPAFTESSPAYISINEDISIKYQYEPRKMAIFKEIYEKYDQ